MNLIEKQQQIISEFSALGEWMDRYNLLIEKGKNCPLLPDNEKNESFLIKGCQSRVWIKAEMQDGKVYFKADSDAVIICIYNRRVASRGTKRRKQTKIL